VRAAAANSGQGRPGFALSFPSSLAEDFRFGRGGGNSGGPRRMLVVRLEACLCLGERLRPSLKPASEHRAEAEVVVGVTDNQRVLDPHERLAKRPTLARKASAKTTGSGPVGWQTKGASLP
jgi:hypothetical protein